MPSVNMKMKTIKLKPLKIEPLKREGNKMSNIEATRLWHNTDGHDKLYGAYYNTDTREFLAVWGRRGKALSSQPKSGVPYADYLKMIQSKEKKGYEIMSDRDRDEVENHLALDEVANRMSGFSTVLRTSVDEVGGELPTVGDFDTLEEDAVVICSDNTGLENYEEGVTYLFKGIVSDTIIRVENMEGEVEEVLADRFEKEMETA